MVELVIAGQTPTTTPGCLDLLDSASEVQEVTMRSIAFLATALLGCEF